MKPIPRRVQLVVVALGYVAVLLVAAVLVYARHMQYVNLPVEETSGGMYAFGDWLLELFIGALLLIPTFLLVLVIRKSETAYTRYSQTLLGLSLTAPICLGVFLIPAVNPAVGLAIRCCGAGGQPVIGGLWPGEAPDLVRVVVRGGNSRLAGSAVAAFSRGPSRGERAGPSWR